MPAPTLPGDQAIDQIVTRDPFQPLLVSVAPATPAAATTGAPVAGAPATPAAPAVTGVPLGAS